MKSIRVAENSMITPWLLFSRRKGSISHYFERNAVKFHSLHASGRAAILEGLKVLGCTADDNALLPAYICETAAIPFRKLGIQLRFYDILHSLEPDMADLARKVDEKTKAVMIVNYFGFPQELGPVRNLCNKHGIFLIEDNSHSMLSRKDSRLLGTFGDIGVSSIYKVLATPNGGVLFVNNDQLIPDNPAPFTPPGFSLRNDGFFFMSSLLKFLETNYGLPAWLLRNLYRKTHPVGASIGQKALFMGASISRVTVDAIERLDPEEIIRRRRSNYNCWLDKVYGAKGTKVLFESLPQGTCPWVFPLLVEEGNFIAQLRNKGIASSAWPGLLYLPPEVQGRNDYANYLAKHLLALPVHQSVNQDYLK
jgi:dTDP-4-amino-4,6-dideoxygalactose transaminase